MFNDAMQRALAQARDLRKRIAAAATEAAENAQAHDLGRFVAIGNEALRESAALTKETTLKIVDQSKKIVDDVTAATGKGPR